MADIPALITNNLVTPAIISQADEPLIAQSVDDVVQNPESVFKPAGKIIGIVNNDDHIICTIDVSTEDMNGIVNNKDTVY